MINDFIRDFKKGYNEGASPKNIILTIIILIVAGCYFIQHWTGIPLFDWLVSLVKWIFHMLGKLLD